MFSLRLKILLWVVDITLVIVVQGFKSPQQREGGHLRLWEKAKSWCHIRAGTQGGGRGVHKPSKPGQGEAYAVLPAPYKGDAKVSCFTSSVQTGQSPQNDAFHARSWGVVNGEQGRGACVAGDPVARGCSCRDSISPGSGHFLGNEQVLLQTDLVLFTAFTS